MPAATKKSKHRRKKTPAPASPAAERPLGLLARAAGEAQRVLLPNGIVERRAFAGILLVAFAVRTVGLTDWMPIIGDESIYLRWAEIVEHQGEWFISLLDAKPPLQTLLLASVRMLIGVDPLFEARMVSVAAGVLSTVALFVIGKLLSGDKAGLVAGGLYSLFPIAVFHDRLAYTESMVNFFGIAIAAASLWAFERPKPGWRRFLILGIVLGLGVFTKQSIYLFAHFPVLVALWRGREFPRRLLAGGATVYGVASLFFAVTWFAVPQGPDTDWRNPALHRSDYYVSSTQLMNDPFRKLPINAPKLVRFGGQFVPWPIVGAAALSLAYLLWRKSFAVVIFFALAVIPLSVQCMLLKGVLYPMRWAFPHLWPLLTLTALAVADIWGRYIHLLSSVPLKRAIAVAAGLFVAVPMTLRVSEMFRDPEPFLRAGAFMATRPHVGYGNREAVEFLRAASSKGPIVVLTDPIPGPPADTMFPFLNHYQGITVYEAWWMKLAYKQPILPVGPAEVMKSQYQRVTDKLIHFQHVRSVYYVTDTAYHTEEAVHDRQPNAKRVASFPKPFNDEAVEVYRLR